MKPNNDELATGVVCVSGPAGATCRYEVVSLTPVAEGVLSVQAADVVGSSLTDAFAPKIADTLERVCKATTSGQDARASLVLGHADSAKELSISTAPAGDLIAIVISDLSPLLKAKSELDESARRFKDLAEASSDWLWECDEALRLTYMSSSFYEATGFKPEDVIGKTRAELGFTARNPEQFGRRETLETGREPFQNMLSCATTPNGRELFAMVSGKPVFDQDGRFRGYRGATRDVTDTSELKAALRYAKSRARDFAEASSDWFWEAGPDLRINYISQRIEDSTNLSADTLTGVSLAELRPDGDDSIVTDHLSLLKAQQSFRGFVFAMQDRDGQDIWCEISGKPVFASDGRLEGYRGVGTNVTEKVKAEHAMRQLASIVSASDDAIFSSDINGITTHWNAAAERIYGIKAADCIGLDRNELSPDSEAAEEMDRVHERVFAGETVRLPKLKRKRKDGSEFWISLTFAPVYDAGGKVVSVAGVGRDISDLVAAEERQTHDAEQLRLITNAVPALIAYIDHDFRYRFVNETARQWFDRPHEKIIGQRLSDILAKETWAKIEPNAKRALQGEPIEFTDIRTFPDGQERGVVGSYHPDIDANGEVRGFYVLILDQTKQITAEHDLRQKTAQLHLVANSVPAAIGHLDRNLVFQFANATALKWYATPERPMLGQFYGDAFPEEISARVLPLAQRALAGEDIEAETTRVFEDGIERTVFIEMRPDRRDDGTIEGVVLLATDVTAAKSREAVIRSKQRQLDRVANSVPAAIAFIDRQQVLRFVNETAEAWYGDRGQSLVGKRYSDIMPPEALANVLPLFRRALAGEPIEFESDRVMKDGIRRAISVTMTPDIRADGSIPGVYILALDITRRKKAESQVRQKERQLAHITGTAPVGIGQVDRDMRVTFANELAQTWYGDNGPSLLGRTLKEFIPTDTFDRIEPLIARALAGESVEFETTRAFANDVVRTMNVNVTPDRREDGAITGANFAITDTSHLKALEADAKAKAEQLRLITDATPALIAYCDRDNRYVFANQTISDFHALPVEDIVGRLMQDLLPEETFREVEPSIKRVLAGEVVEREVKRQSADGRIRTLNSHMVPDQDENGWVRGYFTLLVDITKRKRAEEQVEAAAEQLKLIMDAVPAMIAYLDRDGCYRMVNRTYCDWLARKPEEVIGKRPEQLWPPKVWQRMNANLNRVLKGEVIKTENERVFPDGSSRILDFSLLPHYHGENEVVGMFVLAVDVTERKQTENQLRLLASTDPLTGAENRRSFLEAGSEEIARAKRYGQPFSIVMCDLDHFKRLNDSFGHDAGDAVLVRFAELCRETVRGSLDRVGRLGGEEFALLLPQTDLDGAMKLAERLRLLCHDNECEYEGERLRYTCSLGVAEWHPNDGDLRTTMVRADAALYVAKANGRDQVSSASPESETNKADSGLSAA